MPLYEIDGKRVKTPASGRFFLAPNATVIGDVTFGEDTSVWFQASIRADNDRIVIGDRTNIQEGAILHVDPGFPMEIGADCTIGHMAMLHGCTIGAGCLIGIGAIVLNGARIGAGSLIGAGALVGEGKEIPPGSLVIGAPGRVMSQLSPEQIERVRMSSVAYVAQHRRYMASLRLQAE